MRGSTEMILNPCPFCECADTTVEGIYLYGQPLLYQVRCPSCRARGPASPSEEIAATYWNAIRERTMFSISGSIESISPDDPHS